MKYEHVNYVKTVTCCMCRILQLAAGAPECCTVCVVRYSLSQFVDLGSEGLSAESSGFLV
jgi:hypothetical protein